MFYRTFILVKTKVFKRTFRTKVFMTYPASIGIFIAHRYFTFITVDLHKYPVGELNSCFRREKPMS